jgi:two-component system phosphate regulon response regulator PhoB
MQKTIFILEDNTDLRELYGYILEEHNYNLKMFSSIAEFEEHANEIPDLYLLDVMLPDGDGIALCKTLKEKVITAKVPVIMVSAHKDISDVKDQCPGAEFIAKPFDIDNLIEQISAKIH